MLQKCLLTLCFFLVSTWALAGPPVKPELSRKEAVAQWRSRIRHFLDQGIVPIIDMESSLKRKDADRYLDNCMKAMDRAGVALIVIDGYQAPADGSKGYRWGYFTQKLANLYPDRFITATNGGSNNHWIKGKGGHQTDFIDQTEAQARSKDYPIMGEFEFRHYMSSSQCLAGKTDRDVDISLTSENAARLFALSQETGLAFLAHVEPEDAPLEALETMLAAYPGARIIVCHFGQVRHPERQTLFSPELVTRLLSTYPNLFFDLSTGHPGRKYPCSGVYDTVLWIDSSKGQRDRIKPEYRRLLSDFSHRFVSGFDYGGSRGEWGAYLLKRAANIRLIIRDLPDKAKHDIAYGTAWKLLTGQDWN